MLNSFNIHRIFIHSHPTCPRHMINAWCNNNENGFTTSILEDIIKKESILNPEVVPELYNCLKKVSRDRNVAKYEVWCTQELMTICKRIFNFYLNDADGSTQKTIEDLAESSDLCASIKISHDMAIDWGEQLLAVATSNELSAWTLVSMREV